MLNKGIVLDPKVYRGEIEPPDALEDESRYGNDGVHTNITWVRLPSGLWVRSFNGATSKVEGNGLNAIANLTLMAWVNPGELPATSANGGSFVLMNGGVERKCFGFGIGSGAGADGSKLTALIDTLAWVDSGYTFGSIDTWYHIVCLRNSTTLIFYVNGVVQAGTSVVVPLTGALTYTIGDHGAISYPLEGLVAFPHIYNYALSADQINTIFAAERTLFGV